VTVVNEEVIFDWSAPVDNGLPITGYNVFIRQHDLTYITDRTICDGLELTVLTNTQCTVQLADLTAEPFNLLLSNKIYVKVQAINDYGLSDISEPGSGDGIELVPDAPVSLVNHIPAITSDTVIGISWSDGASDGDAEILDYRVLWD
jgi:hypothetical protein